MLVGAVGAAAGALWLTVAEGGEGARQARVSPRDAYPSVEQRGQSRFVSECGFSHRASDDPIVSPRRPGASHRHDFFGNRSTDAHSTLRSLRRAQTTCRLRPAARSAYWVPTLYQDRRPVRPRLAMVYYYGSKEKTPRKVVPHPPGLRMIAGDPHATKPQDTRIVHWDCGANSRITERADVPMCPRGYGLRMLVRSPDCWDGRRLDSDDHRSHVAYYHEHDGCPPSHPVRMPQIVFKVSYIPMRGGPGVTLSSGSRHSGHADFFSAWDPPGVAALVRRCINGPPVAPRARPCDKPRPRTA